MKLDEIIQIADKAYPDGLVGCYFREPAEDHGDTLAQFIAAEIQDTFNPKDSDCEQLEEAMRVLRKATNEIADVMDALDCEYRRRERGVALAVSM